MSRSTDAPQLAVKSFVFDSPSYNGKPALKMAAKRYRPAEAPANGFTLLFAHGIGTHKEQWEPTLQQILLMQRGQESAYRIREAWSFDWQGHGDSAVLNAEALKDRPEGISIYEWASALANVMKSPHLEGHRTVAIGHSSGSSTFMLATKHFPVDEIPLRALLLVEPVLVSHATFLEHAEERESAISMMVKAVSVRRERWANKGEAFDWLSRKFPWSGWDPRVLKCYTEYGLQDVPSNENKGDICAQLKGDRLQEAISYRDLEGHFESATVFADVCETLPIHVIFGARNDMVHPYLQDSIINSSEGRKPTSIRRVPDVGHMIIQEAPDAVAQAICDVLCTIDRPLPSSKL